MTPAKHRILLAIQILAAFFASILAIADKLQPIAGINPKLAQLWPLVFIGITIFDRFARVLGDALDDGKLNGSFAAQTIESR